MASDTVSPPRLDRRRVLQAALALVDRDGLDALSMRRLAADLDVDPMTVHHHARGKAMLLAGVAELLWEEVEPPGSSRNPRDLLRTLASSVRDLFHRHPEAGPLLLRCTGLSRSELALWRAYLDALRDVGVDEPAPILRSVLMYALGSSYAEVSMLGVDCAPADASGYSERELLVTLGQSLPDDTPPELAGAAVEMIADCDADRCFTDGLDLMLAGFTETDRDRP